MSFYYISHIFKCNLKFILGLYIIYSVINIFVLITVTDNGLSFIAVLIYYDVQIVAYLVSGSPLLLAFVSY